MPSKPRPPRGAGAKTLLRAHFLANLGQVLTSNDLQAVANGSAEWARRVRELRNEEGFQILTHHDRSDLRPGEYMLETAKQKPAFAREISKETRAYVLDRNGFTCQMCGAVAGQLHPNDPSGRKARLHIGHIIDKSKGGTDEPSNLRALCSICNEGAQNITLMRPDLKQLLITLRRATSDDQLEALKWLAVKFPRQVAELVTVAASGIPRP
jgi:hypothetical protein